MFNVNIFTISANTKKVYFRKIIIICSHLPVLINTSNYHFNCDALAHQIDRYTITCFIMTLDLHNVIGFKCCFCAMICWYFALCSSLNNNQTDLCRYKVGNYTDYS